MTVQNYIEQNRPFFHITKMDNIESILANGLQRRFSHSRNGICVVRTDAEDIINEIIDSQLYDMETDPNTKYCLIKILPNKHGITVSDVAEDPINEKMRHAYNYLCKDIIMIDEEDIVKRDLSIGNFRECVNEVDPLEYYVIPCPPIVNPINL